MCLCLVVVDVAGVVSSIIVVVITLNVSNISRPNPSSRCVTATTTSTTF
jgi:hypothetical protein